MWSLPDDVEIQVTKAAAFKGAIIRWRETKDAIDRSKPSPASGTVTLAPTSRTTAATAPDITAFEIMHFFVCCELLQQLWALTGGAGLVESCPYQGR
jgi:hypothetical protein